VATTILDEIVAHKLREIENWPANTVTPEVLEDALRKHGPRRDFTAALRQPRRTGGLPVGLIAEVKKASPSAGVICPDFDPIRIARQYVEAGADCLSVLTDEKFFQGSLEYLKAIREQVPIPLLRKDFMVDERQILEAIEWGADAILLIVAILDDSRLQRFLSLASAAGLSALVEVHDEVELERALALGATLVGVNNRNLRNFTVDLGTTERLAQRLWQERSESDVLLVAESGIHRREHIERVAKCGARAVLIGESLMRETDIARKVRELLGSR
jgi:indole-3-glycerol phosphate synthase